MPTLSYTFRVSNKRFKKYDAILSNGRIVSFGGIKESGEPYDQYKDLTPLKAYRKFDHNDKKRKQLYYKRHGPIDNKNKYTADWFSKKYLW